MDKTVSLKENHLFRRAYNRGKTAADSRLALYVRRNGRKTNRLGLTVSTKLGCAVVRNRARRRLREVFRLASPGLKQGWDVVLVARARTAEAPYQRLTAAFDRAAREVGLAEKRVEK